MLTTEQLRELEERYIRAHERGVLNISVNDFCVASVTNSIPQLIQALRQERERVRVCREALESIANYQSTEVFAGKLLEIDTDPESLKQLARKALNKLREASDELRDME